MPHPSKRARKARNRNRASAQAVVRGLQNQLRQVAMFAQSELAKSERLSKLLGVVIAQGGGELKFKDQLTYLLPEDVTIVEEYDDDTDEVILRTVTPKKPEPELIGSPQALLITDEESQMDLNRVEFGANGEAPAPSE